jgi:hypothetical protein
MRHRSDSEDWGGGRRGSEGHDGRVFVLPGGVHEDFIELIMVREGRLVSRLLASMKP